SEHRNEHHCDCELLPESHGFLPFALTQRDAMGDYSSKFNNLAALVRCQYVLGNGHSAPRSLINKVSRQRSTHRQRLICERMNNRQTFRMQHRPCRIPRPVEPVANERVSDGREMNANLMSSPGAQ